MQKKVFLLPYLSSRFHPYMKRFVEIVISFLFDITSKANHEKAAEIGNHVSSPIANSILEYSLFLNRLHCFVNEYFSSELVHAGQRESHPIAKDFFSEVHNVITCHDASASCRLNITRNVHESITRSTSFLITAP